MPRPTAQVAARPAAVLGCRGRWPAVMLAWALLVWATPVVPRLCGQESPAQPPAAEGPAATAPASGGETPAAAALPLDDQPSGPPEIWYLPDAEGRLRPVVGFTLEDFRQAQQLLHGQRQATARPEMLLESLRLTGKAGERLAELEIVLELTQDRAEVWAGVPLALAGLVLKDPPEYDGPGQFRLAAADPVRGRIGWFFAPAPGVRHRLKLRGWVALELQGAGARLRLAVPRASFSELELTVPLSEARLQSPPGSVTTPLEAAEEGTSRVRVSGLGSELDLAWRPATTAAPGPVEAQVHTLLDVTPERILGQSLIEIRSAAEPLRQVQVRLPSGAQWVPEETAGVRVSLVPSAGGDGAAVAGQTLRVEWESSPLGARKVLLRTRWDLPGGEDPARRFAIAGLKVLEADRFSDQVALAIDPAWQARVEAGPELRTVDAALLPAVLQQPGVDSAWQADTADWHLHVAVAPSGSYVAAEPEFRLEVTPPRLKLVAEVTYLVRGTPLAELALDPSGWALGEVRLAAQTPVTVPPVGADGRVAIPLAEPALGELRVTFVFERELPPPEQPIDVRLPTFEAQTVAPAPLAVLTAPQVELKPRLSELLGLESLATGPGQPAGTGPSAALQFRAPAAVARLVADYRLLPQAISVEVRGQVALSERGATVVEDLVYQVDHEPLTELVVQLPPGLPAGATLQLADSQAPIALDRGAAAGDGAPTNHELHVPLSQPQLGRVTAQVRYALAWEPLEPASSVLADLAWVVPAQGNFSGQSLEVKSPTSLAVQLAPADDWQTPLDTPPGSQVPGLERWRAERPQAQARLIVGLDDSLRSAPTVVEQKWVQIWLDAGRREDRVVHRFSSRDSEVEVQLPAGVSPDDLRVVLDGTPASFRRLGSERLEITWPNASTRQLHVLELRYRFQQPGPNEGRLTLPTAELAGGIWSRQTYYQLVLPRTSHVLVDPPGCTGEFAWTWLRFYWGRRPLLEQAELERWCGATAQPAPPWNTNRYLLSSWGLPRTLEIRIASRAALVLCTSGIALAAGLATLYWPKLRRTGVVLTVVVALLAGGWLYPETSLLLVQAGALGCVLALVADWLRRRRRRRGAVIESGSTATVAWQRAAARSTLAAGSSRRVEMPTLITSRPPEEPPT